MTRPLLGAFVILVANILWLCYRIDERDREHQQWRELAVNCVDTASAANRTLWRCMAQLETRRRCVCFEEPLQSHAEPTGAQP